MSSPLVKEKIMEEKMREHIQRIVDFLRENADKMREKSVIQEYKKLLEEND